MGSSETQDLTGRDGETAKGRRRKGTKGGKVEERKKKGEIVAKRREISEVRTNIIKHVYKYHNETHYI